MASIQDLGNGNGLIYITTPDGGTILETVKNTKEGARNVRTVANTVTPITVRQSAQGEVNILTAISSGTIDTVTVNGVNQIAAPIDVVSSNPEVVAGQIADAMNSYTPGSGFNFTGQINAGKLIVYAPIIAGSTPNGYVIALTITGSAITFNTVPMYGGCSQISIIDGNLGRSFYLDANYNGIASPGSITNAIQLDKKLVPTKGMVTKDVTISSGAIKNWVRNSWFTTLIVDTEGGAASDKLAFIETKDCEEGDLLMLRAKRADHVFSMESESVATDNIPVKNIFTTNNDTFTSDGYNAVFLQLIYDPAHGPSWTELTRSNGQLNIIPIDLAALLLLASTGTLIVNATYYVTDKGWYIKAISNYLLDRRGTYVQTIPNYPTLAGSWSPFLMPTINLYYWWKGVVYKNITGDNDTMGWTEPQYDSTNWLAPDAAGLYVFVSFEVTFKWDWTDIIRVKDGMANDVSVKSPLFTLQNPGITGNSADDSSELNIEWYSGNIFKGNSARRKSIVSISLATIGNIEDNDFLGSTVVFYQLAGNINRNFFINAKISFAQSVGIEVNDCIFYGNAAINSAWGIDNRLRNDRSYYNEIITPESSTITEPLDLGGGGGAGLIVITAITPSSPSYLNVGVIRLQNGGGMTKDKVIGGLVGGISHKFIIDDSSSIVLNVIGQSGGLSTDCLVGDTAFNGVTLQEGDSFMVKKVVMHSITVSYIYNIQKAN